MMTVDVGRSVQVRLALASDQPLRLVRGRVRGIAPEDGPVLETSLQDISQAARLGMFANGGPGAITLHAAFAGPDAYEFTLRMQPQHVSVLRVLTNVLRVNLGPTTGNRIEINLSGYGNDDETSQPPVGLLSAEDAIAYLSDYGTLPFPVDLGMLMTDRDHVVRIYFRGNLSDVEFRGYVDLCRFWHCLIASGAYLEGSSMQAPFVQQDLEVYMMAPDVVEYIVLGLRQSEACWYGLCSALGWAAGAASPIRLVEIE
jgi:hypothetical protein